VAIAPTETVVRITPFTRFVVETGDFPILEIGGNGGILLIMPCGPSDGRPITEADVDKASQMMVAFADYRNKLAEAYAAQRGKPLPLQSPRRRAVERKRPAGE
jgi:hypothetical protein